MDKKGYKNLWQKAHCMTGEEVCKKLEVDMNSGLSNEEAKKREAVVGKNRLPEKPPRSILLAILEQFKDTLVLILLGAAFISVAIAVFGGEFEEQGLKAFIEPLVIILILIANATIGVWQEMNAEAALAALMVLQADETKVLRSGYPVKISVSDLVPGDICLLEGGDKVPADIRIINAAALKVNQSILTGESEQISKDANKVLDDEGASNQDKINMLFSATEVNTGTSKGVAVGTGINSELGKIKELIEKSADERRKTPLQENLEKFGNTLSIIVGVICVLSWAINIPKFSDPVHKDTFTGALYYFKIAVSLAVAAIPEGLPAVITTCLALATRRMAAINTIIRHLSSVETLGCTSIICSDKTGTLTLNDMTVIEFTYFNSVSEPKTHNVAIGQEKEISDFDKTSFKKISPIVPMTYAASVNNEARLKKDDKNPGKNIIVGTPTEAALRTLVMKMGAYDPEVSPNESELEWYASSLEKKCVTEVRLPFTRDRKCMSTIARLSDSKERVLLIKGAAEVVLEKRCSQLMLANGEVVKLNPEAKANIAEKILKSTRKGLRCIALGIRKDLGKYGKMSVPELQEIAGDIEKYGELEKDCIFLGYCGIQDPPRVEVKDAIARCKDAGISVIMITGDNKDTAGAIARKLNLIEEGEDESQKCLEGRAFDTLGSEGAKLEKLKQGVRVFARVEPRHKSELVSLLQTHMGHVVAMTGDGVNDAPALKQADIGIAMGITGSDVAKDASKMILADDNFTTIVNAVEEGRAIYSNIKSFIRYLISSNIGEVVAVFIGSLLGTPEILTSVQLLWMNLVTDGLPAIALGFNPPELGLMERKPRKKDEPIIGGWTLIRYLIVGFYVGIATVGIYVHYYICMNDEAHHKHISLSGLMNWTKCNDWTDAQKKEYNFSSKCDYFEDVGAEATTVSLTTLVILEMIGAINALSDAQSLLVMPPWKNMWLVGSVMLSLGLHLIIVYTPYIQDIFGVQPLGLVEWGWIMIYSFPLILIEECIKFISRYNIRKGKVHREKVKAD